MNHPSAVRSLLPALFVAIISVACGQATADTKAITPVSVTITVPPATPQALTPSSGFSKSFVPIPSLLASVTSVNLSVIDAADQPVMDPTTVPISEGQTVPVTIEVFTGPARTFVGQAVDAQGTVLFQGRSSPVDLDGKPISVGIAMAVNPLPLDLTVATSGTGSGTVTSSPQGIACPSACTASFTLGTDVTLSAAPDAPSTFTGWTGCASSTGTTCLVTMTAAHTVTATFTKIQYSLDVTKTGTGGGTVSSTPAGLACGPTCAATFDAGSSVTLTAAPDATSMFTGWTGCTSSTATTCTVTMTAAKSVTATFTRIPYALTVTKTGTGGGTVSSAPAAITCGATCSALFDAGSNVTLTAVPDGTSTFTGWAGAGCTGTGTCLVSIDAAKFVTATFTRIQYTLTVTKSGTGGGTVSSAPGTINCGAVCSTAFDAASSVTLTAAPDATSTFTGWTGCTSSTGTTCTVTMTAAKAVTATFTRIQYALDVSRIGTGSGAVSSVPGGITCGGTCSALFDAASNVTLTATPDATSTFTGWAGAGCTGTGTCTVLMTAAQAVIATFTKIQYTLAVTRTGTGGGTVTSASGTINCGAVCSAPFDAASSVTLTTAPDATSTFGGWAGCTSFTATTCTVTMTAAQAVTATFTRIQYGLDVSKTGTGGGVVSSVPPRIDCGAICSAAFDAATNVTLLAVPDATSAFTGWAGAGCTGTGTCTVSMTTAKAVIATFTKIQYALDVTRTGTGGGTVSSAPPGITCGGTCSAVFDAASNVTLTATPDATSTFTGWAGASCTGTGTCTVTMTAAKAVIATFTKIQYALDVTRTGTGGGTVSSAPVGITCGTTCSAVFDAASNVTLIAVPDGTSIFTGWGGGACTGSGTCLVTMTAAKVVTATFTRIPYALTVTKTGTGGGVVTSTSGIINCGSACSASFDAGTSVTLGATSDSTSTFAGWTGCTSSTGATCTVTIDAAKSVTATFTRIQYALDVSKTGTGDGTMVSSPPGIACGGTCSGSFDAGSSVTLTATPDATSTFTGWAGAGCTGTGTCTVTMTAAKAVIAAFTKIQYALTVTKSGTGGGTVSSAPGTINCGAVCSAPFDAASSVTLTAAPDATSMFTGWTGCTSSTATTCTVTMTAAKSVTATFTRIQYALTVTKTGTGGGVVTSTSGIINCGSACSASFDAGTSVTLGATSDSTSTFAGWSGCTSSAGATCTVTIDAAKSVTATFTRIQYALDVSKTGTGDGTVVSSPAGIACGGTCSGSFDAGTSVTLGATSDSTSTFAGWSGAGCTGSGTCTVSMTAAQAVTATFTRIQYTLTVTKSGTGGGTVSSTFGTITCGGTCAALFDAGTSVTLTAAPDATSTFAGWSGAGCTGSGTCTVTIDAAKTVTATFTRIQYALTVTKTGTGGGAVSSAPPGIACGATCSAVFDAASSVTLTAAPDATSTFAGWAGAGCTGTGTCTVLMTAAQAVTATFTRIEYTLGVTKTGTGGGTVSSVPGGIDCGATCSASFDAGSSVTLTAAPDATSTFGSWTGCTFSTATTCTVTMTAAKAVTATFTRIQYALTVTKAGTGGGAVSSAPPGIACGATCSASFDAASSVTLTATPDATSTFAGWSGAGCTATGTCTVSMTAAQTVTATFTRIQYALTVTKTGTGGGTVSSVPGGIDCGAVCSASFDAGSSVTLIAAPDATSTFAGWAGAGCTGTGTCTVSMTAAQAVTATFTRIQHALTVTKAGTGGGTVSSAPPGIACGATCSASFDAGSSVTLSATPDTASTFTGWSGACTGTGNCVINLVGHDETVTATFTPLPPVIDPNGLSLAFGVIGDTFKIKGSGFGNTQGTSVVTVGTVPATTVQRWSDREIVALIPAGLLVSNAGTLYDVVVTVNGQQSNPALITLFDRVLGVGGENSNGNLDQFVLHADANKTTEVLDIPPACTPTIPGTCTDFGGSLGVAISANGTTAAEVDGSQLSGMTSERFRRFNTPNPAMDQPFAGLLGQDIAISQDGSVALIAGGQAMPTAPTLVRVTNFNSQAPSQTLMPLPLVPGNPPRPECVHEVALSADGNTAAVITGALDECSLFSSPVKIYRIDNVLSSPTYAEVTALTSSTTPPDRFTDLALSADGSTLIAGRIVFDPDQNQWNAGILRVTGFKTTPVLHNDSNALAQSPTACPPATVDVDLSAEGVTAIVGVVKPSDQQTCPAALDHVFQVRDADLALAQAPLSVVLPANGSAVTNLEGVALNSGGSIALVRTNLTEAVLMRVDAFNTATPVPTNLPPNGSLANMNLTLPPRPQDYLDLQ